MINRAEKNFLKTQKLPIAGLAQEKLTNTMAITPRIKQCYEVECPERVIVWLNEPVKCPGTENNYLTSMFKSFFIMMTVFSIEENSSFSGLSTVGGSSGNITWFRPSRGQITNAYHNVTSAYPLANQCHF